MPTILINTNLSTSRPDDVNCGSKENDYLKQADFKQDLNSIISKLLAKSETMDSFIIKYDVDDVLKNDKENITSKSSCVCKRLANIFSDVLACKSVDSNFGKDENSTSTNEEIKEIFSELKTIRNYQSDLADKFNLVISALSQNNNKLFSTDSSFRPATSNNQINKNSASNQNIRPRVLKDSNNFSNNSSDSISSKVPLNTTNSVSQNNQIHLTGAKKRKSIAVQKNEIDFSDENDDQHNDVNSQENDEAAEIEDENLDFLIEEDHKLNVERSMNNKSNENLPVSSYKMLGIGQQADAKQIFSEEKRKLNADYSSVDEHFDQNSRDIEINSDIEVQQQKNDDESQQNQQNSNHKSKEQFLDDENQEHLDGYSSNNENISNNHNNPIDYDSTYVDYQQYSNSNDAYNNNAYYNSSYNRSQASYMSYKGHNNTPPVSRNISNVNYLKQQQQQRVSPVQNSMMPSKKFRFINQSPTPQHMSYHSQQHKNNYYSIPNRLTQQHHGVKLPNATPNRSSSSIAYDIKLELCNGNYTNDSDLKFKTNQNTPKLSPNSEMNLSSIKNEPATDIDLNELFKDGGPRFLQMELYKDFKPPVFIVDDKYFIDNILASSAYSKSKSRRNFAAHLAKLVFTPRERLESNCNGRFGKKALDTTLLMAIRNTLFKFYPCKQSTLVLNGDTITSGDHDENGVWLRDCIPAIDESNRVLKKQLIAWYKKSHGVNISGSNSSFMNNSSMDTSRSFNYSNTFGPLGAASNASNEDYDGTNYLNDDDNEEDFDI